MRLIMDGIDIGVVPIENSIEGPVGVTLDLLVHDYNLKIKTGDYYTHKS